MRKSRSKAKSQKGGMKVLMIILVLLIIIAGGLFIMKTWKDKENSQTAGNTNTEQQKEPKEVPQPKTMAGDERPIAYVLDNNINAMPQAGLEQADLVYEIIVEGGETRLMAIMKNKNVDKIGPIRSARHYFLDYALENDAIYVHFGQSPQAASDIKSLGITDINGIYYDGSYFWRVKDRYSPHNAVTSTAKIEQLIEKKDYRTTTNKENVLNYVVDEVDLSEYDKTIDDNTGNDENTNGNASGTTQESPVKEASKVTIPYSSYNTVKYEYDAETKTYVRYSRDKKQTDWNTNEAIKVKNIIITKCANSTLDDGTDKGRQTLANVKILDGYYITNGKSIPIKCEKKSRSGQTVYKDLDGNEIKVNDGKTFIQICPLNSKISFE